MKYRSLTFFVFFFAQAEYIPTKKIVPPSIKREFRGLWIATTLNTNWPSKPGLSTEDQKKELLALIQMAEDLHLNVLFFQVRPCSDTFYQSSFEPWSEYLTGTMGKAPDPFYDPLEYALKECHKRAIELHAWINPFRVRINKPETLLPAQNHISKTHPEWVKTYGNYLWLDPGEPAAQNYVMNIVKDITRRYDIDGIVIDDYFYPYKQLDKNNQPLDFPDTTTKERFEKTMNLAEWRRRNINTFVQNFYHTVKRIKPWVKVGISPFGIWRPHHPTTIQAGVDAYNDLFADSKLWLHKGWLDYFIPQLYWKLEPAPQSYKTLLKWWKTENKKHRLLVPGNYVAKLNTHTNFQTNTKAQWGAEEIINQIIFTRNTKGASGNALFGIAPLLENKDSIRDALQKLYKEKALVPECSWLKEINTQTNPLIKITHNKKKLFVKWTSAAPVARWILQSYNENWQTFILPGNQKSYTFITKPKTFSLTPVLRNGTTGITQTFDKI